MQTAHTPLPWYAADRWFPAAYNRGGNGLVWVGLVASFVAVFIKLWTPIGINRIPEALYTLPFFYALYRNWRWLKHDRIIQLLGLAIALPVLFFGLNYLRDPAAALEYRSLEKLAKLFFFVPIAWWLGGNPRTIGWFLITAFAGLILACLLDPNLQRSLTHLVQGHRVNFGILNAQHVALFYSLALLVLLGYLPVWRHTPAMPLRIGRTVLVALGIGLCLVIIVGTQTRIAGLALLVCTVAWLPVTARASVRRGHARRPGTPLVIVLLAGLGIVIALPNTLTSISNRVEADGGAVSAIAAGDWDKIPYSSLGIRFNTWLEALPWIAQRPLIGWGGDVRAAVIATSDRLPAPIKQGLGHFHNGYVEFTLAYGLLGLALVLGLFYLLLADRCVDRHSVHQRAIGTFTLYAVILLAVMNAFESYLFFWSGVFAISVILAPLYSLRLADRGRVAQSPVR